MKDYCVILSAFFWILFTISFAAEQVTYKSLYSKKLDLKGKTVPFDVELSDGFLPGSKVFIKGTPHKHNPDKFEIALRCSPKDHALYLNPRLEAGYFVVDSLKNDSWESIIWNPPSRFTAGKEFTVEFECTDEGFRIVIDEKAEPLFVHRKNPNCIKSLYFFGDVSVREVTYEPSNYKPVKLNRDSQELDVKGKFVPFDVDLPDGFLPGSKLIIKGTPTKYNPDRFEIALKCGPKDQALYLNPRLEEKVFVTDSLKNDKWENQIQSRPSLVAAGVEFTAEIECNEEGFRVAVDGSWPPFFKHRRSPDCIKSLYFKGDVTINKVTYETPKAKDSSSSKEYDLNGKTVPFALPLLNGFHPGSKLTVRGRTPENPADFCIDFECGSPSDVALHLSPRFNEGVFIRNSRKKNTWDKREDRSGKFFFTPGVEFLMQIECEDDGFWIVTNGVNDIFFKHRLRAEDINNVRFYNDVVITGVTYTLKNVNHTVYSKKLEVKDKSTPFEVELPDSFNPESKLVVKGIPHKSNPDRFEIVLKCGPMDQSLYLNPRLGEEVFVVDSKKNGKWEKQLQFRPLPFEAGTPFTVEIKCKEEGFRIVVDGVSVPFFEHRKNPDCTNSLFFKGDVSVSEATYEPSKYKEAKESLYSRELNVKGRPVPFEVELPDGFDPGSKLTIKATPYKNNPDRFEIALKCGSENQALYLNPRLQEKVFIRDSQKNGKWEKQVWSWEGDIPFAAGTEFTLQIKCKDEGFRILVNEEWVPFFEHRKSPNCIKSLYFKGDVSVSEVIYEPSKRRLLGPANPLGPSEESDHDVQPTGSSGTKPTNCFGFPKTPTGDCCFPSPTLHNGQRACKNAVIFFDSFNNFDSEKWRRSIVIPLKPDYEFTVYENKPENLFTEQGDLHIKPTINDENFVENGAILFNQTSCTGNAYIGECSQNSFHSILPPINSARIDTKQSFNFRYGIVQIQAKLPIGDWIVSEIALMPADDTYGLHYDSGKVRIVSRGNPYLKSSNGRDVGYQTVEGSVMVGKDQDVKNKTVTFYSQSGWRDQVHNFTIYWDPDDIVFFADGVRKNIMQTKGDRLIDQVGLSASLELKQKMGTNSKTKAWGDGSAISPFDQSFYLRFSVYAGGVRDFEDDVGGDINIIPKPWRNSDPRASFAFWKHRKDWQPTWGDDTDLIIKSIKVTAI